MPALGGSQLGQHLLLHPAAVSHHQLEHGQGVRVHSGLPRREAISGAPQRLPVSLQGQEGVAQVELPVALPDVGVPVLGLRRGERALRRFDLRYRLRDLG